MSAVNAEPIERVQEYFALGFDPVPVEPRSKRITAPNWQTREFRLNDFRKDSNIGLRLGKFGLSDVDLDCGEARIVAPLFLPATGFVFGRASSRASHWFYRVDPVQASLKLMDPTRPKADGTIVELRGVTQDGQIGFQTVAPGSIHQDSGELVEFEPGMNRIVANVDADTILRAVHRIGAAALLARHFPAEGSGRNEAFLAMASVLAGAEFSEADAELFNFAIYSVLWGERANRRACASEVRATYDKHQAGSKVVGIPRLKERVRPEAVDAALRWLGIAEVRPCASERIAGSIAQPLAIVAGDTGKATPKLISAQTLYDRNDPAVPGLLKVAHNRVEFLHPGLSILAARQKAGKSWLTMQIAIFLAGGRVIEGLQSFEQWKVLYGALEEPETRTASRLRKLTEPGEWLANVSFFYELLPLMGGGAEQLETMIEANQPQLMVLDTLTAVIKNSKSGGDVFRSQYEEVARLRKIAERFNIAILVVHHLRKQVGGDAIESIAGTGGITAACDAIWTLRKKPEGHAELEIIGRETEESCLAVRFEPEPRLGWRVLGDASEEALAATRRGIVQLLREEPNQTPGQIAKALGKTPTNIRVTLSRLAAGGQVMKDSGKYRAVTPSLRLSPCNGSNGERETGEE